MHGTVTMRRKWTLADGDVKDSEKKEIRCKYCNEVLGGYPAECPHCGAVLKKDDDFRQTELEIDDGVRLVRVDDELTHQRQEYYAALIESALANCWKAAAVGIKFKARFGEWPRSADRKLAKTVTVWNRDANEWVFQEIETGEKFRHEDDPLAPVQAVDTPENYPQPNAHVSGIRRRRRVAVEQVDMFNESNAAPVAGRRDNKGVLL
jgi:hypothetical protein